EDLELTARAVVVAAGSSPVVPPVFDEVRDRILTSDDVLELRRAPAPLAVIGTGIIGLELGQAPAPLGTRVTLLDRAANVGPLPDPGLPRYVQIELRRHIDLELEAEIASAKPSGRGIRLEWKDAGGR